MKRNQFSFVVNYQISTRCSETAFNVSYSVKAPNAFIALRKAYKILVTDFNNPIVDGFIVNYDNGIKKVHL